jgi:hypothetical protein
MAYIRGSQIRPELGRTDYTPFLQGAMQGAQSLQRGVEQGLSSIERGIQAGRQQKETLRLEKEQQKLRNEQLTGMIETGTQQARAALLLYGQDPMIRTELENGLAFLSSANPAESKAVVAKGIGDTLNLLGQVGVVAAKNAEADASARALHNTIVGMGASAQTLGVKLPFDVDKFVAGAPSDPQAQAAYYQAGYTALTANTSVLSQLKIMETNGKGGFATPAEAIADARKAGLKNIQVTPTAEGRYIVGGQTAKEGEEYADRTIKVGDNTMTLEWDSSIKKWRDKESGTVEEDLTFKNFMGVPTVNPLVHPDPAAGGGSPMGSIPTGFEVLLPDGTKIRRTQ